MYTRNLQMLRGSQDQICSGTSLDSRNFSSEFLFPNFVLLCSFLGLRSEFTNPSLQSFKESTIFSPEHLNGSLRKSNVKGDAPEVVVK